MTCGLDGLLRVGLLDEAELDQDVRQEAPARAVDARLCDARNGQGGPLARPAISPVSGSMLIPPPWRARCPAVCRSGEPAPTAPLSPPARPPVGVTPPRRAAGCRTTPEPRPAGWK